jgi:single-strand DNA-binding protein
MSNNHITIHGNIGREPELKYSQSGMAVAEFSVAVTSGKDDRKKTTWHNVKVFGKLAENVCASFVKGDTVLVCGRIEDDEYQKKDGTKGVARALLADEIGASVRWTPWVKDQTEKVMAQVGQVFKSTRDLGPEEPF